ncbi:MAG: hypothetical protein IIY45_14275, partial [Firmicutes bacterium]|nr:hypothetical protein [Bacillota bacterium]
RIYQVQKEFPCTFIRGNREEYMLDYRDGKKEKWEYGSGTGNLLYTYEALRPADFAFFETMTDRKAVKIEGLKIAVNITEDGGDHERCPMAFFIISPMNACSSGVKV